MRSSFNNFEVIVSDDNSPLREEISEIINCFSGNPKVIFHQQPSNLKEPGNKSFLTTKATGEFNIVIGDDDVLGYNTLSLIYNFVCKNPNYDIYGLGYFIADENNKLLSVHCSPKATILTSEKNMRYLFEFGVSPMGFMHPATFCCRTGIELALPYRDDVGIGEDLCFLLQAAARGHSIITIPMPLFNWRKVQDIGSVTQGNQSAERLSSIRAKSRIYEIIKNEPFAEKVLKDYISSPSYRFKFLYMEVLRDPLAVSLSAEELGIEQNMYRELTGYSRSWTSRFSIRLRRLINFLDLCKILGVPLAVKWVLTSIVFRIKAAHNGV